MKKSILTAAILSGVLSLSLNAAQAAIISVDLTDGGPGAGAPDPGETFGAVLVGNVNTINGLNGAALNGININSLTNSAGNPSGVAYSQSATVGGTFSTASAYSGTIGNGVMTNFADRNGTYTITLTNVNAGVGALYDVYLYSARGFANTGVARFTVNGIDKFILNESMVGDYTEANFATQAAAEAGKNSGDYVRFTNVNLDTLTISLTSFLDGTNGGSLAAINGFQIVQVPEPSTALLGGLGAFALLLFRRRR